MLREALRMKSGSALLFSLFNPSPQRQRSSSQPGQVSLRGWKTQTITSRGGNFHSLASQNLSLAISHTWCSQLRLVMQQLDFPRGTQCASDVFPPPQSIFDRKACLSVLLFLVLAVVTTSLTSSHCWLFVSL